jgi:hypothetical protein
MKRELTALRPVILRSAAEAKMRYDEQVRISHAQVTLLRRLEVLHRADEQFDEDRARLLELIEQALLFKAEREQSRTLPSTSISTILAFCDRHWFDQIVNDKPRERHRRRRKRIIRDPLEPTRGRVGLQVVPEIIKAEWDELQQALEVEFRHCL